MLRKELHLRTANVAVFFFILLLASGLILIIPTYTHLVSDKHSLEAQILLLKNATDLAIDPETKSAIANTNTRLALLSPAIHTPSHDMIDEILAQKSPSIHILAFVWNMDGQKEMIEVRGIARDRESLREFVDKLRGRPLFVSVDSPTANYVKSANNSFSISIEIKKEK